MSELDDIVAAAGIVIVDTAPQLGDGGDAHTKEVLTDNGVNAHSTETGCSGDTPSTLPAVAALEASFSQRYTMNDPDYAQTVDEAEDNMQPPCVPDYRERRSRDNFNRNRDWRGRGGGGYGRGGGGGGFHHRDNYRHDNRQSRGGYNDRNWHHRDGGDGYRGNNQSRYRDRESY